MAFTAQEKSEASRFVNGLHEHMLGLRALADVVSIHGHDMRSSLVVVLTDAKNVWEHSRIWFQKLSDAVAKAGQTRVDALLEGKASHAVVVSSLNAAVAHTANIPELAAANARFAAARDIIAPFDWSLPYTQPRHDNNPNTPFDDSKTIVGPHGDWETSVNSMNFVVWYIGETMRDLIKIYTTAPVFPQEANEPLKVILYDFAHLWDRISRVYSMHIEVESAEDEAIINADHAASSGARTREFFRAMLQMELLYNQRSSVGTNWHGREFLIGAVNSLNMEHATDFFVPISQASGEQWTYDMVVANPGGQYGGPFGEYIAKLTDFWQILDAWAEAGFGFFHFMPAATQFVPIEDPPPGTTDTIPLGFFNTQALQVAQIKAEMAGVTEELTALDAGLRALEGTEVANV